MLSLAIIVYILCVLTLHKVAAMNPVIVLISIDTLQVNRLQRPQTSEFTIQRTGNLEQIPMEKKTPMKAKQ